MEGTVMGHHLSPGRRSLLRAFGCGCAAMAFSRAGFASDAPKTEMSSGQALDALKQGNKEFMDDHPHQGAINRARAQQIAGGDSRFAAVPWAFDSRVSPELVFRRALVDLFRVRVAGNSVDRTA